MSEKGRHRLNSSFIKQDHQAFSESKVILYNQWASNAVIRILLVIQQKEDENHMVNTILSSGGEKLVIGDDLVKIHLCFVPSFLRLVSIFVEYDAYYFPIILVQEI